MDASEETFLRMTTQSRCRRNAGTRGKTPPDGFAIRGRFASLFAQRGRSQPPTSMTRTVPSST